MRTLTLALLAQLAVAQPTTPLARLDANIQRITRSVNATWGIYIKSLDTGDTITLNADQSMDTMSVIKIPLMAEVFRQIDAGKFKLTDRIPYTAESMRPGTGIIRSLDPGVQLTVKDLLTLMIIVSDNTATDLLYDKVGGPEPVNKLMAQWGLSSIKATGTADAWFKALRAAGSSETFHRDAKTPFGLTTPRDMGKLLEMLEKGEAVSKTASDQMLTILRGQICSSRLPRYLSGWRIPHKTGDFLPYVANDVGVLESGAHRVVICVFTSKHYGNGYQLEEAIGRIAELTANYFSARP